MDDFIPIVRLKLNQYPKWFSPQIRHQVKCMHTLQKTEKTLHCTLSTTTCSYGGKFSTRTKKSYEQSLINNFAYNRNPKIFHYIIDFMEASNPYHSCQTWLQALLAGYSGHIAPPQDLLGHLHWFQQFPHWSLLSNTRTYESLPVFFCSPSHNESRLWSQFNCAPSSQFAISRILKLTLSTFSGDRLAWQTF